MIQTQEKSKKLHFGPDLGPLVSNLDRQFQKKKKKILAASVTRYHDQLLSCTISEKANDPILRKLTDG